MNGFDLRPLVLSLLVAMVPFTAAAQSRVVTADPQLDAMYQLALEEVKANEVSSIKDWAYNNEQSVPCDCFETGEKWHYVWTRDLSYAADLSLARLAPERVRNSLLFKATGYRDGRSDDVLVAQDTGSGGSWPISTDRVVWFLAAKHLTDDSSFNALRSRALRDTLAQDRDYAFDPVMGLYRGETSFLDWREQTYPKWTAENVTFIGESFALSTNVLHYMALRDAGYAAQARALKKRIAEVFWDPRSKTLRSVVGPSYNPLPLASQDLLGVSLAVLADILPKDQAAQALGSYPVAALGSPVVWPQQPGVPIYHNRAMWPFVSAYAMRAARKVNDAGGIEFELNSILRAAAQNGSNMENYEITTLKSHVDDGKLSGPVVNSPRQLWSVAGMVAAVEEGVFGVGMDHSIEPKIPQGLALKLFGDGKGIQLWRDSVLIELVRPAVSKGDLWVEQSRRKIHSGVQIQLKSVPTRAYVMNPVGASFAPEMPVKAYLKHVSQAQDIRLPEGMRLYRNGKQMKLPYAYKPSRALQCLSVTSVVDGIESLPSEPICHSTATVTSALNKPTALSSGRHRVVLKYNNTNGPINTGITAAVKKLQMTCGRQVKTYPIVMPHSVREQESTSVILSLTHASTCTFALLDGVNMSDLKVNADYTGGKGGTSGRLNEAQYGNLLISPLDWASIPTILK